MFIRRTFRRLAGVAGVGVCAVSAIMHTGHAAAEDWVTLVQDNTRLSGADTLTVGDTQWKEYSWGDLNLNGWVDLIVVRRQPWGAGKRQNILLLNENGVLVDRTAEYASAVAADQLPTDVADQGFLTPTIDAAGALVDVTNNGWLDFVTAVTLSDGNPKHIGYPRVYVNLANDGSGNWQGFRFENARIPEMLSWTGQAGHNPRFEHVAVGDVTANGFADLWFSDSDYTVGGGPSQQPEAEFNDRLLANQGAANPGFFTDVTQSSFSGLVPLQGQADQPFPVSSSSYSAAIADLNASGAGDIVKVSMISQPTYIGAAYNNAATPGSFDSSSYQVIATGLPVTITLADLNSNGLLDIVIAEEFTDRYRLNQGVDANGHVTWGPLTILPGPAGFAGNSIVIDLDNNGFNDIIIADVHPAIPGCNRFTQVYRNTKTVPNATFENASAIIPAAARQGVIDVAAIDITGNGWLDLVLGRCSGTDVWINTPQLPCPADLTGTGNVGVPDLIQLLSCWGEVSPGCEAADLTGSGSVGVPDLISLLSQWGACP